MLISKLFSCSLLEKVFFKVSVMKRDYNRLPSTTIQSFMFYTPLQHIYHTDSTLCHQFYRFVIINTVNLTCQLHFRSYMTEYSINCFQHSFMSLNSSIKISVPFFLIISERMHISIASLLDWVNHLFITPIYILH